MRQTMKKKAAVLAAAAVLLPCGISASAEGLTLQDAKSLCSGKAMLSVSDSAAENVCRFGECSSTVCLFAAKLQPVDQGNLTDAEFEELKALYEKADAIEAAHADDDSFWEEDNPELDAIWERMEELERMAGWYDDEADDDAEDDDAELKEALTEEEYQEYLQISARLDEIDELICGDSDDMTDEEYDAAYAVYEDETDRLWARLDELYEKAGIFCSEVLDGETVFIDSKPGEYISVINGAELKKRMK